MARPASPLPHTEYFAAKRVTRDLSYLVRQCAVAGDIQGASHPLDLSQVNAGEHVVTVEARGAVPRCLLQRDRTDAGKRPADYVLAGHGILTAGWHWLSELHCVGYRRRSHPASGASVQRHSPSVALIRVEEEERERRKAGPEAGADARGSREGGRDGSRHPGETGAGREQTPCASRRDGSRHPGREQTPCASSVARMLSTEGKQSTRSGLSAPRFTSSCSSSLPWRLDVSSHAFVTHRGLLRSDHLFGADAERRTRHLC